VNNISRLPVVPPAKVLHGYSNLAQRIIGLFNLNLKSAVAEQKRIWVVQDNSHAQKNLRPRVAR
jgi:hypothetical protein